MIKNRERDLLVKSSVATHIHSGYIRPKRLKRDATQELDHDEGYSLSVACSMDMVLEHISKHLSTNILTSKK